ncbi:dolichyl-diphosphooligosaccharide--protein glycosyltransferase subunit 1 [Neocloeon triangulifer]|uniref:dolichyl-diphosphooligosaccharide--protein glycosyltransferase subunit 1 n=1 Tax=Neocloeon triangulifer TaxID=2078957 RepID=UPI00286FAAE6|nr:dolichyl-diphosphooligosaccharide--protein glycosyltransferase subunit 1 [Neocloeon triangulifer]
MSRVRLLFLSLVFLVAGSVQADVVNKNVDTAVDISTQLVKIAHKVTVENVGKTPVKSLIFGVPAHIKERLSFISAKVGEHQLRLSETKVDNQEGGFWKLELRSDITAGRTLPLSIDLVLGRGLIPHPSQITQKEKQLVLFEGNAYYFSPYLTEKQTLTVNLGTSSVESFARVQPVSQSDTKITYGPYEKVAPFKEERLNIHYENNSPFLTITKLERVIEVSHWGNIAVEETIDMEHQGATLKGPFSRYEYQRETQSGIASVKSFRTALPASAVDVYYRDDIGNISTSHMRVLSDSVELELRPRFPLFGGWKTHYTLGYNVPSYEYLFNQGDQFVLKMRLMDHVVDDMYVEELTTKIILPEGCHSIELTAPYSVKRLKDTLHQTYLDTKGRPVVSVSKSNLVENHIDDFELRYTFAKVLMFQEPLLVIFAFFALFLLVIIYVRLDFSITDEEENSRVEREQKDK